MTPIFPTPNEKDLPAVVVESLIKAYGHDAELCVNAFRAIRYDGLNGCFCLAHCGMYVGIESSDGYMHT